MHDPFGLGGDPVFSQDQTRLVQVQSAGVGFVVWGSRPPGQAEALSTLQDYLGLLAEGKYAEAASQLLLEESPAWNTMALDQASVTMLVPEADPTDPPRCSSCCAPIRSTLARAARGDLQAQVDEATYLFVVTFAGPDGQVAEWPLCAGVPLSKYCYRRDSMFKYYVRRQPDGATRSSAGCRRRSI